MAAPTPRRLVEHHRLGTVEVLTVRAAEVVDAETIQRLGREVRQAFAEAEATAFVLDLSEVRFLTSGALGLIIHLRAQLMEQGRRFALAGADGEVARVLACTRLSEIVPVYPSAEVAAKDLRCPPGGGTRTCPYAN